MKNSVWVAALALFVTGCMQVLDESKETTVTDAAAIPNDFKFKTTQSFSLQVTALDNGNKALHDIPLEIGFMLDDQYVQIMMGATDNAGRLVFQNTLPSYLTEVVLKTDYPGLPSELVVPVQEGSNSFTIGGTSSSVGRTATVVNSGRTEATGTSYLSTYDTNGVPNNLEPVNDYIPQDLLDLVNASLPERAPVPTNNPQYLSNTVDTDTRLSELADVWVTFVSEGAGYKNALGYYTYDLSNPPKSASDINNLYIVFPNVSLPGSGGNLASGSKVSLGRFPANTGIGWFLVPDGWNGKSVTAKSDTKFSTKALNTFTTEAYHQHTVLLNDPNRELLLLGMEDTTRPGGDNDFNDAVFYVTANPYRAIITDNLVDTKQAKGNDKDGDGVIDKNDAYPTDPARAFDVFTPGKGIESSLAFEDQWPSKGDYDMNDLVVDYNFQTVTNTANEAVEIIANLSVKAVGASYQSGFGIELPVAPDMIRSVSGALSDGNIVKVMPNGTEAEQKNAVIMIFENAHDAFKTPGFVNTKIGDNYFEPVNYTVTISFAQPVKMLDLGYAPFNPFIFVDNTRSREVHLPDFAPTTLADAKLLGTNADSSRPEEGRFYKSGNNLPWAINIALPFEYPQESRPISDAHLKFSNWAQSGGITYKDWYKDLSGYREKNLIYKK